jgi:phenylalanyl-tRNA synthetase beta subunit
LGGFAGCEQRRAGAAAEAFRSFKGDVENLLAPFAYRELSFDRETAEYFHPGRSARAL